MWLISLNPQYGSLNSILLGTCFKHYSFRSLKYAEMESSVVETLLINAITIVENVILKGPLVLAMRFLRFPSASQILFAS